MLSNVTFMPAAGEIITGLGLREHCIKKHTTKNKSTVKSLEHVHLHCAAKAKEKATARQICFIIVY